MSKSIFKFLVSVALLATSLSIQAKVMTQDEAKVRSNIQGFSALADQGAFEYLGRLFASKLLLITHHFGVASYHSVKCGTDATVGRLSAGL
ncbi:hypothetical protein JCM19233_6356 [Vibrio astriarenae]|nr:hypothetical protein JCM19233_6356 [Vibrio sp. C7]